MEFASAGDRQHVGRVVLISCILVALIAIAIDFLLNSASSESMIRSAVYLSIAVVATYLLKRPSRVHLLPIYLGLVFGALSLSDAITSSEVSLTTPGTILTVLVLVAITYIGITDNRSSVPVQIWIGGIAIFSMLTVAYSDFSGTTVVGFILVGTLGQSVVIWVVHRMFQSLASATVTAKKHARIQKALAECSQALLNRGTKDPLYSALLALLDATEAYYAYIDVNRVDQGGTLRWEIVAEAQHPDYPDGEVSFVSGDYSQMEEYVEILSGGKPVEIITSQLPMPLRGRYESEGIKAELVAPIITGGRWMGTLGYTDHIREGAWTRIEVEGLMRAAEMVGAFWEREAAREGLMELAKAKDRFIAAVSHELRTPLSAVVGFAGALTDGVEAYSTEELTEMATVIYTQSIELTHLVDDLLTSERAASGNLTIHSADISLLDECLGIVQSTGLDVAVSVLGESVSAHADPLRTRQILRNLLTNAARYGGDNVEVEVAEANGKALVSVRDNGVGVRHIDVEQIFEPYYRTQGEGSAPDSVGLGLAVARQLARLMGGDLEYRRSNQWTVFELSLPLSSVPAPVT
jgi:signal transduction histidine kinase